MNAIIFPGQGSQVVGMGLEFYNNFEIVKKIFHTADQKLDFKISKLILEGPDNELKLTKNTQPAPLRLGGPPQSIGLLAKYSKYTRLTFRQDALQFDQGLPYLIQAMHQY